MSKRARDETAAGGGARARAGTHADGMSRYRLGRLLGEGAFAAVRLATDRKSNMDYAMKLIDTSRSSADAVKREVEVLTAVGRHANVTSLVDFFADPARHEWVLVLELAEGGEVFEHIVRDGHYSEADAAAVIRDVGNALIHLHGRAICHRDIKPENLLITSTRPDAPVKLADFGLACFCGAGREPMRDVVGTINYIAPEIIRAGASAAHEAYTWGCDLWSVGVCLFTLLGGYLPFDPHGDASDKVVQARIMRGETTFTEYAQQWVGVSDGARRLIAALVEPNPARRMSADALLTDSWVTGGDAPTHKIPATPAKLQEFNAARRVWRTAADCVTILVCSPHTAAAKAAAPAGGGGVWDSMMRRVSGALGGGSADGGGEGESLQGMPAEAVEELHAAFRAFDNDNSGEIDPREMRSAMRALGASESDAAMRISSLDADHDGRISFTEFCSAAAPLYQDSEAALRRAFEYFDTDRSGFIERDELEVVLCRLSSASGRGRVQKKALDQLFDAADTNHDGKVSFEEFMSLFQKRQRGASGTRWAA